MTDHPTSDQTSPAGPVDLASIAAVASVAADFLHLAARTGIALERLPSTQYDAVVHAVEDAADSAWYAATLLVDAREPEVG